MTSGEDPKPSEVRGGAPTGDHEAQEKGAWASSRPSSSPR
jgi:hypothetical protein